MSLHINRFVDRLRSADHRSQREIILSLADAKDLHADITKLLLKLQAMQEQCQVQAVADQAPILEIEVDGGRF